MKKAIRGIKRGVNKNVLKVPSIEQKVLDATSNESWGPHGTHLADIAQASRNYHEYQMIMSVVWKRLSDTGKNWRHVYKALTVLEYLVANGSERVIEDIREHAYQISNLASFQYIDSTGRDQGINVRKKSQTLVALVNDKEKIQEAREKAATSRDNFRNTSGGPGDDRYNGQYGSRDEDRNGYGRERDWNDRDSYGRDGDDRYGRDGYGDDEYRGKSQSIDGDYGAKSQTSDRDDGHHSSRGSNARIEDGSPDGSRLEPKLSGQNLGAPPSYEDVVTVAETPAPAANHQESAPPPSVAATPPSSAATPPPAATTPSVTSNKETDEFDFFDPRGAPPVAPSASSTAEVDLFGSLADSFSSNVSALVPSEPLAPTSTNPSQTFVAASTTNQPFDDPFGDGPFRAVPSTDPFSAQHSTSPFGEPPQTVAQTTVNDVGFGDGFDPTVDILAGILPPTGPPARTVVQPQPDQLSTQTVFAPQTGQPNQTPFSSSFPGQFGQPMPGGYQSVPPPSSAAQGSQSVLSPGFPDQGSQSVLPSGFPDQGGQSMLPPGFPAAQSGQSELLSGFTAQGGQSVLPPGFPSQGSQSMLPPIFPAAPVSQSELPPGLPAAQGGSQSVLPPGFPSQGNQSMLQPGFTATQGGQSELLSGFPAQNGQSVLPPGLPAAQNSQSVLPPGLPAAQNGQSVLPPGFPPAQGGPSELPPGFPPAQGGQSVPGFTAGQGSQSMLPPGFPSGQSVSPLGFSGSQNTSLGGISSQAGFPNSNGQMGQPNNNLHGGFQPQVQPPPAATPPAASLSSFYQQPPLQSNTSMTTQPPSITSSTDLLAIVPQQPAKEKFETKSTVWTDTLNRGLVNLNISGAKTNPLSDIGIDFEAINRKEKRMEKPSKTPVTSNVAMGKAMGSGSGIGRAGASVLRPAPNPMAGSGMGMGAPGAGPGFGGVVQPMGMNNMPQNMGMGMNNIPQNMGMGMNNIPQNMGMGMNNMPQNMGMGINNGHGFQMQPPPPAAGFLPPGSYNPMMGGGGGGGYGQQPYGGYR